MQTVQTPVAVMVKTLLTVMTSMAPVPVNLVFMTVIAPQVNLIKLYIERQLFVSLLI